MASKVKRIKSSHSVITRLRCKCEIFDSLLVISANSKAICDIRISMRVRIRRKYQMEFDNEIFGSTECYIRHWQSTTINETGSNERWHCNTEDKITPYLR